MFCQYNQCFFSYNIYPPVTRILVFGISGIVKKRTKLRNIATMVQKCLRLAAKLVGLCRVVHIHLKPVFRTPIFDQPHNNTNQP